MIKKESSVAADCYPPITTDSTAEAGTVSGALPAEAKLAERRDYLERKLIQLSRVMTIAARKHDLIIYGLAHKEEGLVLDELDALDGQKPQALPAGNEKLMDRDA